MSLKTVNLAKKLELKTKNGQEISWKFFDAITKVCSEKHINSFRNKRTAAPIVFIQRKRCLKLGTSGLPVVSTGYRLIFFDSLPGEVIVRLEEYYLQRFRKILKVA